MNRKNMANMAPISFTSAKALHNWSIKMRMFDKDFSLLFLLI